MLKLTFIIIALIGGLFSLLLSVVSVLSGNKPTPKNVRDVYDEETYGKWKRYNREHGKLKILSTAITTVITLVLLLTNSHAAFAKLFPYTLSGQIGAVILLECIISSIVGVAVGYVSTMKIEQKYGFNRSSMKTFVIDKIATLVMELCISYGFAGVLGVLYEDFGVWMIPVFAIVGFVVSIVGSFMSPIFMRLRNKFTILEDGELKSELMALLNKYGYKVRAIKVMNASKRTTKLNAYFTGIGKMKTIVLYDNLLDTLSTEEICAVFAHEMGHGLHKDILKAQVFNMLNLLLIGAVSFVIMDNLEIYADFGFIHSITPDGVINVTLNYGFAYVLIGIVLSALRPITGLIMNARSRRAEYKADRQAVIEGYGEAMISAFKKMSKENFSHLSPSWINVVFEYSHPPIDRRIKNIERSMRRLKRRAK